ncbi:hypothetical protein ACWGPD_07055 [Streptomyces hirsutus]
MGETASVESAGRYHLGRAMTAAVRHAFTDAVRRFARQLPAVG